MLPVSGFTRRPPSQRHAPACALDHGLPNRIILVVGHDRRVQGLVASSASKLQAEVRALDTPEQLPLSLRANVHDLVVVCGTVAALNATAAMAQVRRTAGAIPCMVVTFVHPCLAQVTVSDTADGPTSTQVMDRENLARLPAQLIARDTRWLRGD